jgi:hypothetical protein
MRRQRIRHIRKDMAHVVSRMGKQGSLPRVALISQEKAAPMELARDSQ